MNNRKIPKWTYDRIQEICNMVVDNGQMQINRRQCLRRFLTHIWLESEENGWTIITKRTIRTDFNALGRLWWILVKGKRMNAYPLEILPKLIPELKFHAGKAAKDSKKRKSDRWLFDPKRPIDDIGKLLLADVDTGETFDVWALLKKTGKAPQHNVDLIPKSQYELKKREKLWLKGVSRGRMHMRFIEQLKEHIPMPYYKQGIRSLNHLYNAKAGGDYVTYDHTYKLTFGGRYYDKAYQNLPGDLKTAFRTGLLNYDIAGCSLACLNTLFARYDIDYRVDSALYQTIMEKSGLERKQSKLLVLATIYKIGKVTVGIQNGIGEDVYHWLGNNEAEAKKLLAWWKQQAKPLRIALGRLVRRIKRQHRKNCASPRQYNLYPNDIGLVLNLKQEKYEQKDNNGSITYSKFAQNKGLLTHMVTGIEQAYIREVIRLNPGKICMLDHDGFAAIGEIIQPEHEFIRLEIKD